MDSKTIQKYRGRDYKSLHGTAKRYFHKFIRLRDTDEYGYGNCIANGQRLKYGTEQAQAGHYYSAGLHRALEFNEWNVNLQSKTDNFFKHDFAAYSANLTEKIGIENKMKLDQLWRKTRGKMFREDRYLMIEIIEKYKVKCKELAKTKMFEVK